MAWCTSTRLNRALICNSANSLEAQAAGAAALRAGADAFAANVLPVVRQIQASGATTLRAIAAGLNARGIRTTRGGAWHDSTVRNLLAGSSIVRGKTLRHKAALPLPHPPGYGVWRKRIIDERAGSGVRGPRCPNKPRQPKKFWRRLPALLDFNLLEQAAAKAIDERRFLDAIRIYLFMSDGDASLDGGYLGERIGQCYEALNDVPAARFWYGRAIEENPDVCLESREARTRLGRESYDDLLKLGHSAA